MLYEVIELDDEENPTRVVFRRGSASGEISDECLSLRRRVSDLAKKIRSVSTLDKRKKLFFRLCEFCSDAFVKHPDNLYINEQELKEIETDVSDELILARNTVLVGILRMSSIFLISGAVLLICSGMIGFFWPNLVDLLPDPEPNVWGINELEKARAVVSILGFSLIGLYFGLVISSLIRVQVADGAESLKSLQFHGFNAYLYNSYLTILLFVLLGLLYFGAVQIGVAGILLNDFVEDPRLALLVGAVCAAAEGSIAQIINRILQSPDDRGAPVTSTR